MTNIRDRLAEIIRDYECRDAEDIPEHCRQEIIEHYLQTADDRNRQEAIFGECMTPEEARKLTQSAIDFALGDVAGLDAYRDLCLRAMWEWACCLAQKEMDDMAADAEARRISYREDERDDCRDALSRESWADFYERQA